MRTYYPRLLSLVLVWGIYFFLYPLHTVNAHTGGGPPFLEVNGIYAQTNIYYIGNASINIPQDIGPDSYLANKPISFKIDTKQLLIPPEIVAQSTFRWNFDYDSTKKSYEYGTSLTHVYAIPKTYLVTLEVKAPGDTDYTLIDTVNINALPFAGYHLPRPFFTIETDNLQANKMIVFTGTATYDAHATFNYLAWDFGDGTISHNWIVNHTYHNLSDYENHVIIMRVIDSKQFVGDAEVVVKTNQGKFVFIDGNGNKASFPVSSSYTTKKESQTPGNTWLYMSVIGILVLMGTIISMFAFKKKSLSKENKYTT